MIYASEYGARWHLRSPLALPRAHGVLANRAVAVTAQCSGGVRVRTLGGERCDAGAAERNRRFYIKDIDSSELYMAPGGSGGRAPELFDFSVGADSVCWDACFAGLDTRLMLTLPEGDAVELWQFTLANRSSRTRSVSVYPAFDLDEHSPHHRSAEYRPDLEGIVARGVALDNGALTLHKQYVLHEFPPRAWQCSEGAFVGHSGWLQPAGTRRAELACDRALQWDTAMAAFQYSLTLAPGDSCTLRFLVGTAASKQLIRQQRERYLSAVGFARVVADNKSRVRTEREGMQLDGPDEPLNHFVNHWLVRQIKSPLATGRRLALSRALGLVFVQPAAARAALVELLAEPAHGGVQQAGMGQCCAELIMVLQAYIEQTADDALLRESLGEGRERRSVFEAINRQLHQLSRQIDKRGLLDTALNQGLDNWRALRACTSATFAAAFAFERWAQVCEQTMLLDSLAGEYRALAHKLRTGAQAHLWDGGWYARGICARGRAQGVASDSEGRIHLKPQAWALLAGSSEYQGAIVDAVEAHLQSDWGLRNLAPAYIQLDDESAKWLQWHPGCGLNGAHLSADAAQYAYALYCAGEPDKAFAVLQQVLPCLDEENAERWGVLPTYIPDFVTADAPGQEERAGRASAEPSGSAAGWVMLALECGLLGIRGSRDGVKIEPQLPREWYGAKAVKCIRGATLYITIERDHALAGTHMTVDGEPCEDLQLVHPEPGRRYQVEITLGRSQLRAVAPLKTAMAG